MPGTGRAAAREQLIGVGDSKLYLRDIGAGMPIVVVHGGPDFDHEYLLPEMDRLADSFRLVYYDQRGRGRSFSGQAPEDVGIASEISDLDRVREWIGVEAVTLLGHSWGGLIAMEYATRRPHRVSHLMLMNTAPATPSGVAAVESELKRRRPREDVDRMQTLASDARYESGEVGADIEHYRLHFGSALRDRGMLERLLARLRVAFTSEGVLAARQIERRLYEETWHAREYDLLGRLGHLLVPTLIIHGDNDFIPLDVVREIADAIEGSSLVVLPDCGHFSYLEEPDAVRASIAAFLDHQ